MICVDSKHRYMERVGEPVHMYVPQAGDFESWLWGRGQSDMDNSLGRQEEKGRLPTSGEGTRVVAPAVEIGAVVETDREEGRVRAGAARDVVVLVRYAREVVTACERRRYHMSSCQYITCSHVRRCH